MDDFWIKALGEGARGERLQDDWRSFENGFFEKYLTFAQNSSFEPDDRVVLYAAGWGAFFAVGTVRSYPYEHDDDSRWRWRVDFSVDHAVPYLHHGIPLRRLNVADRDLRVSMRRRSHIRLMPSEYDAAVAAIVEKESVLGTR
jgi:hypothetical protein